MKVFDFHCHPSLKAIFASNDFQQHAWRNAKGSIDGILASQCSLAMLADEGINLICVGLHAPERAMTNNWKVFMVASQFRGWDFDSEEVRKMGIGEKEYFFILRQDLMILKKEPSSIDTPASVKIKYGNRKVKIITTINDYNVDDLNTIHLILTIEGTHSLFSYTNRFDEKAIDFTKSHQNLVEFINQVERIFSINLTHLSYNPICNHAYGLKLIKDERFLPKGNGISKEGFKWLDTLQKNPARHRVIIDVKHMSLGARKQYYAYRRDANIQVPIVATHIGVTGFSSQQIPARVLEVSSKDTPKLSYVRVFDSLPDGQLMSFYPISINLYDDDIIEILASGGLLGLSLDQRILGVMGKNDPYDIEYVSKEELELFIPANQLESKRNSSSLSRSLPQLNEIHSQLVEQDYEAGNVAVSRHPHGKYFIGNLLHIVKVAQSSSSAFSHLPNFDVWNHICVGSDFDGLIDPIDFCRNVNEYDNLKFYLSENLVSYSKHFQVSLGSSTLDDLINKILFQNGLRFMQKHFV